MLCFKPFYIEINGVKNIVYVCVVYVLIDYDKYENKKNWQLS